MVKQFLEGTFSYKVLTEYGDESLVSHVDQLLDDYDKAFRNGEDLKRNWIFRKYEEDEEVVERRGYADFKKYILTHDDGNLNRQLEILTDFDMNSGRFQQTLVGAEFKAVSYFEQPSKVMFGQDTIKETLIIMRSNEVDKPDIVLLKGTILKPTLSKKVIEKVSLGEQLQNE